jgi:hypothetical protein
MRLLGDEYIKSEFRAHRSVENPVHIVCKFLRIKYTEEIAKEEG